MPALAEGEDYASAGRASGREKLAEWKIKAPPKKRERPGCLWRIRHKKRKLKDFP
jgi:hypothetical protein